MNIENQKLTRDASIYEIYKYIIGSYTFVFKNRKIIYSFIFLGGVLGFVYSKIVPVKYISTTTFIVDEGKSAGSGLSALAGQFGFEIGGSAGSGILSGDNILFFLKSESLCREVLLEKYDRSSKKSLADVYFESKGLKKKLKKKYGNVDLDFSKRRIHNLTRFQDSVLQSVVKFQILKEDLVVERLDKKSSFIKVSFSSQDERLSFLFTSFLLDLATQKYILSKTKFKLANINSLQKRADSLSKLLNVRTNNQANFQQDLIDVNPAMKTALVKNEISAREKTIVSTLYSEVIKNLEISKTILSQESPSLEIIDRSTLPLEKKKVNVIKAIITGAFIMFIFGCLLNVFFYYLKKRPLISLADSQI